MLEKAKQFLKEVRIELRKVSWPTRKDTVQSTWVVLTVVFIFGIYFFFIDGILSFLMAQFLGM